MSVIMAVPSTVDSGGLLLRPWVATDLPALLAAHRDPLLRRYLGTMVDDAAGARHWLAEQDRGWAGGQRLSFAVVPSGRGDGADSGAAVGHVTLKVDPDPAAASGEVGYWTSAAARGRGVAPRAVEALTRWAFGPESGLALAEVELVHAVPNEASCRVATKCGFRLRAERPPLPPRFPRVAHLHVRTREQPPPPSA